jgi:hypothetical protein
MEDLLKTRMSLLKNSGGFAEILYLLRGRCLRPEISGAIAMAWPFSTPSNLDLSAAASTWQNYQCSTDRISIKENQVVKVHYRYSRAAAASPPQEPFFCLPAPSLAS